MAYGIVNVPGIKNSELDVVKKAVENAQNLAKEAVDYPVIRLIWSGDVTNKTITIPNSMKTVYTTKSATLMLTGYLSGTLNSGGSNPEKQMDRVHFLHLHYSSSTFMEPMAYFKDTTFNHLFIVEYDVNNLKISQYLSNDEFHITQVYVIQDLRKEAN